MTAALWKLIAAFALLIMPIGMAPASAAVAHSAQAATMMGHCADHDDGPAGKSTHSTDCAGCVAIATLPARVVEPMEPPKVAAHRPPLSLRSGILPETSTPPPKLS